jgi:hypothetical protein
MYTAARDRVNRNELLWPPQKLIAARVASARYFSPGADDIQQISRSNRFAFSSKELIPNKKKRHTVP